MNENQDKLKQTGNTAGPGEADDRKPEEKTGDAKPGTSLERAMLLYYENPCRETFCRICDELVFTIFFNVTAVCPTEFGKTGMSYKFFETHDFGYAYIVYTSTEKNPEMKTPETYAFIPWRNILLQAAEEKDCTGIVINPYSGHRDYVWVNSVYIRWILHRAAEVMEEAKKMAGENGTQDGNGPDSNQ